MTEKRWLASFAVLLILLALPAGAVMAFNYYIDPYWNFKQDHEYNDFQVGFDERQQKLNYLFARKPEYDSILIGTSRTTYMNSKSFQKEKVFNLGLSGLHIDEYAPYLRFAGEATGVRPDRVYVEMYLDIYNGDAQLPLEPPEAYRDRAKDHLLKLTTLFSYDTYEKAKANYEYSKAGHYPRERAYTRDNQVTTTFPGVDMEAARERNRQKNAARPEDYHFNESFKEALENIKATAPDSEFVVFSDLEQLDRLAGYFELPSYMEAYERSVREIIEVFGRYRSFYMENEFTTEEKYWFDYVHFYPEVGDRLIHALETGEGEGTLFVDVDASNVEQYFADLRRLVGVGDD